MQELQRLHSSTVAEAAVLSDSAMSTVAFPRHLSLATVTSNRKHKVARCPITRVIQDAFYCTKGVIYLPQSGKATVDWFIEAEKAELQAAALGTPPVCGSLPPRQTSVTVLVGQHCHYSAMLLNAISHIASSRCGCSYSLMCEASTSTETQTLTSSVVMEAARSTRIGFLAGVDCVTYLNALRDAFCAEPWNTDAILDERGATVTVSHSTITPGRDVVVRSYSAPLTGACAKNTSASICELQRVIARVFTDHCIPPRAELFQPLPHNSETAFLDHTVAIHNEFFSLLVAPPEVRRGGTGSTEPLPPLTASDVFIRFVPKNLRCDSPIAAQVCFHGLLLFHEDKEAEFKTFMTEARKMDRNPLYGIGPPSDSRDEAIGIHVLLIQAHSHPLQDAVTSYGLLGSPGKRLHRDGNFVLRKYEQLVALTPQLLEQHFLIPCSFQSCIPLNDDVGRVYFGALDNCRSVFAAHFGDAAPPPVVDDCVRASVFEYHVQGAEESMLTRSIGLGFGSPAMRIGQLISYLETDSGARSDQRPDALVGLLMSALSALGPGATVFEAFEMAKDVMQTHERKLKQAEDRIESMESELRRLNAPFSPMIVEHDAPYCVDAVSQSCNMSDSCPIYAISLPSDARDRLMAALGIAKGSGGVSISVDSVPRLDHAVVKKLVTLVASALRIDKATHRPELEESRGNVNSLPLDSTTRRLIETAASPLVVIKGTPELYLASVCSTADRSNQSSAMTTFYHMRRDGGVRQVQLAQVLQRSDIGMVVLKHSPSADQCFWYKKL